MTRQQTQRQGTTYNPAPTFRHAIAECVAQWERGGGAVVAAAEEIVRSIEIGEGS